MCQNLDLRLLLFYRLFVQSLFPFSLFRIFLLFWLSVLLSFFSFIFRPCFVSVFYLI
jgi:hypothetical protein